MFRRKAKAEDEPDQVDANPDALYHAETVEFIGMDAYEGDPADSEGVALKIGVVSFGDADYHVTFGFTPAFAALAGRGLLDAAQDVSGMSEDELAQAFEDSQTEA